MKTRHNPMMRVLLTASVLALVNAPHGLAQNGGFESPPVEPAESLGLLHVRDGYRVELMAAEPLVQDPVAITWGADGRLWVAEMADYPLGLDGQGQPGGRIRWLQDSTGDGKYDKSVLFAEGLRFPNGVMPWEDGVFVTAAPQILFLRDTDGDGVADSREVVFEGFQEDNQQLRVNGLRWGLTNHIYCASGANRPTRGTDTRIQALRTGETIELGSRDLRFDPFTGKLEPQSGPTQFGRNRDDWGNWFGTMNSYPLWHYVLEDRYMRRNPSFAPPDSRQQLIMPRNPRVYPAKTPEKRYFSFQHSGHYTSACSGMVYRDNLLFGRDDRQHAFTCEPFHNLVQHNVLTDAGTSFAAHRDDGEPAIDFFASKDRWCRPVMVRTGPEGALWVVDMYRYVIEHPQFLNDVGKAELEPHYRAGYDRGRIYRIVPDDEKPRLFEPLHIQTTTELVSQLESPNGPTRDLVQQLLIIRQDKSAIPLLERLVKQSRQPLARLHAACTLEGLDALSDKLLQELLTDEHAGIRRHAIRLAEKPGANAPALRQAVRQMADDPDAKVRLQLACTVGEWPDSEAASVLGRLAIRDCADPFATAAIISSLTKDSIASVLKAVLAERVNPDAGLLAGRLLTLSATMGNDDAIVNSLVGFLAPEDQATRSWQYGTVASVLDALDHRGKSLSDVTADYGDRGDLIVRRVAALSDHARRAALDTIASGSERRIAIRLMARDKSSVTDDIQALGDLLHPQTSAEVQLATVNHLGTLSEPQVADILLDRWSSHGPRVRAAILGVLPTNSRWLSTLLDAIAEKRVVASDIDAASRQTLLLIGDRTQRARTAQLLANTLDPDRKRVVEEHLESANISGDAVRGRALFRKHCATCHKLDGVGNDIGPNLVSVTDKRPASLLTSILNPSAAVDSKHVMYIALTVSGKTYSGILSAESANSITLTTQENKQQVILRQDLEELRSTGKSLMPDGFEKQLKSQDLADVITYVAGPHQES